MVCLGNICRSPLAEGILRHKIEIEGLDWIIDSAGTAAYHIGNPPDPRSIAIAKQHQVDISRQRARQVKTADLDDFDLILTMDHSNYRNVLSLVKEESQRRKIKLMMDFALDHSIEEVPDPYWDDDGFQKVYQMLDTATEGILAVYTPSSS
ncbi:MAG: low molecular weight protein-tyrosine-phosphatase [Saprospiraceae bacterium]